MEVFRVRYKVWGKDKDTELSLPPIDVIHICFPYDDKFADEVINYVEQYRPKLCIIHSTVVPGTTDSIQVKVDTQVVYSPVRGRHGQMVADLRRYVKFIGGYDTSIARELFKGAALRVREFPSARALELAKLIETTYSGLLIAWAQEMKRYCGDIGIEYFSLMPFLAEIDYLPPVAFQPGHIGGHCIMANLDLLEQVRASKFLDAIRESNQQVEPSTERLFPVPMTEFAS